ncbi:MAG: hypothetical protein AAFW68_03995 [Pseudomonadota bacterium]
MRAILTILAVSLVLFGSPAAAKERLFHSHAPTAQPRTVAAFTLAAQRVELLAVTRKARADTRLRKAHITECENMAKVFPGYPQPAFVSVDFRIKF